MNVNDITYRIIGSAYKVYNKLGPGLLESVYQEALCYQLIKDGLHVESQLQVPLYYDEVELQTKLRLDILVEDNVIVELKSVDALAPVHFLQIDTYLRLTNRKVGLLINFNTDDIKSSIHRRINSFDLDVQLNKNDKLDNGISVK